MDYKESFRTSAFGGFNKEDVLGCIDQLVNDHEQKYREMESALAEKEEQRAKLSAENDELKGKLRQSMVQLQKHKNKMQELEETLQTELEEKSSRLEEVELSNRQLSYKLRMLEERLSKYADLKVERQKYLDEAEQIAKEKTNKIILEAKEKVEAAYNERVDEAQQRGKALFEKAKSDAAAVLNLATQEANNIVAKARQESDAAFAASQKRAEELLDQAQVAAKQLLAEAADKMLEKKKRELGPQKEYEARKTRYRDELDHLKSHLEQEVHSVVQQLDSASKSVHKAKTKVEGLQEISKTGVSSETAEYTKVVKEFLK